MRHLAETPHLDLTKVNRNGRGTGPASPPQKNFKRHYPSVEASVWTGSVEALILGLEPLEPLGP